MSILLYGAETWPVAQAEIRRLRTFQIQCLQDILGLTLWDRQRNVDILKQVGEVPMKEQLKQRRLHGLGLVQWMPDHHTQKLLRCGPQGEEKKARGNSTVLD